MEFTRFLIWHTGKKVFFLTNFPRRLTDISNGRVQEALRELLGEAQRMENIMEIGKFLQRFSGFSGGFIGFYTSILYGFIGFYTSFIWVL